jgi:hypothetical protein
MLKIISQTALTEAPEPESLPEIAVDESNYLDSLADELDQENEQKIQEPPAPEGAGIQEILYTNGQDLAIDGRNNKELIEFDYVTRHGRHIHRLVEPHHIFISKSSGGPVLVTWDRSVNDIRAFIIGGVQPNGVRYEGSEFPNRPQLQKGRPMRPVSKPNK